MLAQMLELFFFSNAVDADCNCPSGINANCKWPLPWTREVRLLLLRGRADVAARRVLWPSQLSDQRGIWTRLHTVVPCIRANDYVSLYYLILDDVDICVPLKSFFASQLPNFRERGTTTSGFGTRCASSQQSSTTFRRRRSIELRTRKNWQKNLANILPHFDKSVGTFAKFVKLNQSSGRDLAE